MHDVDNTDILMNGDGFFNSPFTCVLCFPVKGFN